MNIYYDENMPFAAEFFSDLGELTPFEGRTLTAKAASEADVLLVRSITKVNETLLSDNSSLRFVGTATIGVDHIDQPYLSTRGIDFSSAPGCNAISVAEYVISALIVLAERYLLTLKSLTVGIIGAGNTGSRLSEKLKALGISYVLCDPILEANTDDSRDFVSLEQALSCDVVSCHVPLILEGEHPTYHLLDKSRLEKLREDQILISACRGEVIDNEALLKLKKSGHGLRVVLDVWEGEPNVLLPLVKHTEISTAHIAGYSLEGKARGTEMLYQALCQQLKISPVHKLSDFLPAADIEEVSLKQDFNEILLKPLVKMVYDVRRDDAIFRQQLTSQGFDTIRKTYPARREFSSVQVSLSKENSDDVVYQLGFSQPKVN